MIIDRIINKIEKIESIIYEKIVAKHIVFNKKNHEYENTVYFDILYHILVFPIWYINFLLWYTFKRIICIIKGCNIKYYKHYNMPEGCDISEECVRCGAFDEFGMESEYPIILK